MADDVAAEMEGPVGAGAISATDAEQYREEHGIAAPAQAQPEPAQPEAPARQLQAA